MGRIVNNVSDNVIDLKEIFTVLRRRFAVIAVITLAALIVGGIYNHFFTVPIYQSEAVLLVTQSAPVQSVNMGNGMEGMINSIGKLPEMTLNTYVNQLQGEAVMERVVRKLKLDRTGYKPKTLTGYVSVQPDKENNVIKLMVTHTNPYLAAQIANTTAQEFLDYISEMNEQQMNKSVDLLKEQAASTGVELKRAVANLNHLEAQPRGVPMLEKLIAVETEDLSKYQSQALQASLDYQRVLAGKNQAEKQLQDTPPIIETTKFEERLNKSILVEEDNPIYTQLVSTINEKSVIAAEKSVEVKSLQTITKQLTAELKALQSELGQKKNLLQMAQNEAKRLQATDSMLRTKIDETNIGRSVVFGEKNLVIISPASVPGGPVKPNKMQNMAIALLLGLAVSLTLVFTLNYLDNTVKTPQDIEGNFGLPVLGQIPAYNPDKPEVVGGGRLWITTK